MDLSWFSAHPFASVALALAIVLIVSAIRIVTKAPVGFEDENGFHLGESTTDSPRERTLPRTKIRFVENVSVEVKESVRPGVSSIFRS